MPQSLRKPALLAFDVDERAVAAFVMQTVQRCIKGSFVTHHLLHFARICLTWAAGPIGQIAPVQLVITPVQLAIAPVQLAITTEQSLAFDFLAQSANAAGSVAPIAHPPVVAEVASAPPVLG